MPRKKSRRSDLIRNVGQFWHRDDVFWGKPKNPGMLIGILATAKRGEEVDFWDQRGVYILYADYHLVYIGQTGNQGLGVRLRQHLRGDLAGRWNMFSWFGIRYVKENGQLSTPPGVKNLSMETILDHVEAILITAAEPPMNSQGGRFGTAVERYLQRRDSRLPGVDVARLVTSLKEQLDRIEAEVPARLSGLRRHSSPRP